MTRWCAPRCLLLLLLSAAPRCLLLLALSAAPRCLLLLLLSVLSALQASAQDPSRSLDFFPPLGPVQGRPPLVAFVTGNFWGLGPANRFDWKRSMVRPLRSEGVAVTLLRHRSAAEVSPPELAADVATGLAELFARADALGFDPERVYLAGHGSGAQLAALLVVDPRYLEAVGLSPAQLAGVIPISGLYELDSPEGVPPEVLALVHQAHPEAAQRAAASPLGQGGAQAPRMLVLVAAGDIPGFRQSALALAEQVRQAGQPEAQTFVVVGRDHGSILLLGDHRNGARRHLLGFIGAGDHPEAFRQTWAARRYWRDPGFSTRGFWEKPALVREHEGDPRLGAWLRAHFAASGSRARVGASRYQAIELDAWLEASGAGSGRWLVTETARHEQAVLDLEALRAYGPMIVIGLDEQRNLFEVVDLYNTKRRSTWQQPEPEIWILARPLGGFLYFREEPPRELVPSVFGMFGLTPDGLRLSDEDPLAPLRELEPELREVLIREQACVSCHRFRGAGGRSGHIRASDGEWVGGFGLPLEDYPPEVWRRFLFEQAQVAEELGSRRVDLTPEQQQLLEQALSAGRR